MTLQPIITRDFTANVVSEAIRSFMNHELKGIKVLKGSKKLLKFVLSDINALLKDLIDESKGYSRQFSGKRPLPEADELLASLEPLKGILNGMRTSDLTDPYVLRDLIDALLAFRKDFHFNITYVWQISLWHANDKFDLDLRAFRHYC